MLRQNQASANQNSSRPQLIQSMLDAMKVPDLRTRILFTIAMLVVFRFVAHVPVPGVDCFKSIVNEVIVSPINADPDVNTSPEQLLTAAAVSSSAKDCVTVVVAMLEPKLVESVAVA